MTPTLYITRNGMLEPLGQSQVLSYLRGLSRTYKITLVSFEKPEDIADAEAMARVRADCEAHGIHWLPQRFHLRPRGIAPAWSMLLFLWLCLREVWRGNARLIHARSYIPAAVALVVYRLTGTPFVFDMRALWPDEMITAGRLRQGSQLHRMIVAAERACLRRAATVVCLTHAAVDHLRALYPNELAGQTMVVIPTCADLDRFVPAATAGNRPRVYACLGSVLTGWFRLDWLAGFFAVVASRDPDAQFQIVTRDDPARVRAAFGASSGLQERLEIYSTPPQKVHEAVQRHSVNVMFYAGQEVSELGRSPTRMAEVLGCGLPVVANSGVGDVARVINEYRVGVLATGNTPHEMNETMDALLELWKDPDLAYRCRAAAEAVFSLTNGTRSYAAIYAQVLDHKTSFSGGDR